MTGVRAARLARLAVAALAAVALAGCLEPYRAHVDPAVVTADLRWTREDRDDAPDGDLLETVYRYQSGAGPPYPAILQVFSLREFGRRSTEDLLALAQELVASGMEAEGIRPDSSGERHGTRSLRNGLETHWFSREGTVTRTGQLFRQEDVRVRILGEVGYDGRSSTGVLVVGIAQVESTECTPTPILNNCGPPRRDLVSWVSMVGDEACTVRDACNPNGLVYNLVTHG